MCVPLMKLASWLARNNAPRHFFGLAQTALLHGDCGVRPVGTERYYSSELFLDPPGGKV
jgi:hypothetical protein